MTESPSTGSGEPSRAAGPPGRALPYSYPPGAYPPPQYPGFPPAPTGSGNGLALASLLIGIIALATSPFLSVSASVSPPWQWDWPRADESSAAKPLTAASHWPESCLGCSPRWSAWPSAQYLLSVSRQISSTRTTSTAWVSTMDTRSTASNIADRMVDET